VENTQSRKKFLDLFLGAGIFAWLGTMLYPITKFLIPPKAAAIVVNSVEAGELSEFPPNSSKIIRFGRYPVIVVRKKNGDFTALSATCTHLDCTVQYKSDTEQIWCACHNGFYDLQGKNMSGPPPKPLTAYSVAVARDKVIVSRKELA